MLTFLNSGGTVNYASNGIGVTNTDVGYFAGLRVIIDDQVPVTADAGTGVYTCYLASQGVIRTGSQFPLTIKTGDSLDTWTANGDQVQHLPPRPGHQLEGFSRYRPDQRQPGHRWQLGSCLLRYPPDPPGSDRRQHPLRRDQHLISLKT